ncbi:isocitrate lyase/phosphoenolpyruvate mutase family protein [Roseomonas sp. E05]|uniref:isocitrate lyase/PEP mutase family protein n=1 Tax=Roseomonas sp. E05 TaxID=3046310 RepID=UPI0024BB3564|nr:isocitrate lyase/phosphoenolpyruvate mutase family protein [Roseomonas sp. E05]MDJ0390785.1 isocitrate lyase/phosphoenolpyruvate mutase family protein [Roseomonas sp. E05]
MNCTGRRAAFRAILAGDRCVHPASVYDPLSACMAEELGCELGMFAGSVAALVVLGAPDIVLLTLSEFAGQAHRICRAGALPLLVDADHGYGNALNVRRTVEELETAGVAALTIEDTLLPQPFGASETRLISVEEGIGKLRAALDARQDAGLAVIGRTSAPAVTGLDNAIARLTAYQETGIDAMFFTGIHSHEQLDAISAAARVPLILGGLPPELADADYLAARGVRVALRGHQPVMAAIQAAWETMRRLQEGASPQSLAGMLAPEELLDRLTGKSRIQRMQSAFLGLPPR